MTEATLKELGEANWKARLAAMEEVLDQFSVTFHYFPNQVNSRLSGMDTIPTLLTAVLICKKPGLKDNNFQVLLIDVEISLLIIMLSCRCLGQS